MTAAIVLAAADLALIAIVALKWPGHSTGSDMSERVERGFDDAAIGMMILTAQLEIVRVNDALCALLARQSSELVGHSILEFTHPDDLQQSVELREGDGARPAARPDAQAIRAARRFDC